MKRIKLAERTLPNYTLAEELFNAISHGAGVVLGIIVCLLCAFKSQGNLLPFIGSMIYGCSMIVLYAISMLYHSFKPGTTKKVFQILDHCSIYILIAGTYTPILLTAFVQDAPMIGWGLLAVQWIVSTVAIVLNAIDLHRYRYFSYTCSIVLGWSLVFVTPFSRELLSPAAFGYVLSGGISYTIGALLFVIGCKHRWFHSIFHIFVVLGSFLQFIGIYAYIL